MIKYYKDIVSKRKKQKSRKRNITIPTVGSIISVISTIVDSRPIVEIPPSIIISILPFMSFSTCDAFVGDGTLNVHIRHLSEKIETDPNNPSVIKTVWGVGYIIEEFIN